MTPGELAQAIHARHAANDRAKGRPWRRWEHLSASDANALVRSAERLQAAYDSSDAPTRGMTAEEIDP